MKVRTMGKVDITSWSVAVGAMVVEEDTRVLAKVAREVLVWRPGLKLIIMMAAAAAATLAAQPICKGRKEALGPLGP